MISALIICAFIYIEAVSNIKAIFVNRTAISPLIKDVAWKISVHTRGTSSLYCHFFGFFTELLGYSSGLRELIPNIELRFPNCTAKFYSLLFKKEEENMKFLFQKKTFAENEKERRTFNVVIYHGTSCDEFPKSRSKDDTIRIGRYMFEKDDYFLLKKRSPQKRDSDRIFGCARRMDEIWIPSEFQRKIFSRQIPTDKIQVIPEGKHEFKILKK